jgi:hypothetical protein
VTLTQPEVPEDPGPEDEEDSEEPWWHSGTFGSARNFAFATFSMFSMLVAISQLVIMVAVSQLVGQ